MDEIVILEYDLNWPKMFELEAEKLKKLLDRDLLIEIEHFGSTAVPDLSAKPIIDILVGVKSVEKAKSIIPVLESIDYVYWQENPNPERMFFVKGMPPFDISLTKLTL